MSHAFYTSLASYYHWAVGWWVMISAVCLSLGVFMTIGKLFLPDEVNLFAVWRAVVTLIFSSLLGLCSMGAVWGLLISVPIAVDAWVMGQ